MNEQAREFLAWFSCHISQAAALCATDSCYNSILIINPKKATKLAHNVKIMNDWICLPPPTLSLSSLVSRSLLLGCIECSLHECVETHNSFVTWIRSWRIWRLIQFDMYGQVCVCACAHNGNYIIHTCVCISQKRHTNRWNEFECWLMWIATMYRLIDVK